MLFAQLHIACALSEYIIDSRKIVASAKSSELKPHSLEFQQKLSKFDPLWLQIRSLPVAYAIRAKKIIFNWFRSGLGRVLFQNRSVFGSK